MKQIEEYLLSLGWQFTRDPGSRRWFIEGDGQARAVVVDSDGWILHHFTDSDVDTDNGPVAIGRYVLDEEGVSLEELKNELQPQQLQVASS